MWVAILTVGVVMVSDEVNVSVTVSPVFAFAVLALFDVMWTGDNVGVTESTVNVLEAVDEPPVDDSVIVNVWDPWDNELSVTDQGDEADIDVELPPSNFHDKVSEEPVFQVAIPLIVVLVDVTNVPSADGVVIETESDDAANAGLIPKGITIVTDKNNNVIIARCFVLNLKFNYEILWNE